MERVIKKVNCPHFCTIIHSENDCVCSELLYGDDFISVKLIYVEGICINNPQGTTFIETLLYCKKMGIICRSNAEPMYSLHATYFLLISQADPGKLSCATIGWYTGGIIEESNIFFTKLLTAILQSHGGSFRWNI